MMLSNLDSSIHSSIHVLIHPSILSLIHLSIYPPTITHPPFFPSFHLFLHPQHPPATYRPTHSSIQPICSHPHIYPSTIHPIFLPPIHLSVHPFFHPSNTFLISYYPPGTSSTWFLSSCRFLPSQKYIKATWPQARVSHLSLSQFVYSMELKTEPSSRSIEEDSMS